METTPELGGPKLVELESALEPDIGRAQLILQVKQPCWIRAEHGLDLVTADTEAEQGANEDPDSGNRIEV
jgi:hypothetical protein